jgi:pimeloyl-ACP methyl ester carboxylesterase
VSQIVLIHGIAQEQESADTLEAKWLPALAGGVRKADRPSLADRLWRGARPGDVECRMAFYGDIFLDPGRMGGGQTVEDLTPEQQELAESLALEWLRRAEKRAALEEDRDQAQAVLLAHDPQSGPQQGWKERGRPLLKGLAGLRWFAPKGMALATRFGDRSLAQVTRYLTEEAVNEEVQQRIAAHVGPETVAIIGHSLGSVAAFQAAHRLQRDLPLLLTLGSPLGLRSVVYDLLPETKEVPPRVQKWVNLTDADDLVAAEPDLAGLFNDTSGVLDSNWTLDNGSAPHKAEWYLTKRQTGAAVAATIEE